MSEREQEQDRRKGKRVSVQLWVKERDPDGVYYNHATNLSSGGMYLERAIPHPVGTEVELHFTLPDESEPIVARARIVNAAVESMGMGLAFVDLAPEVLERIEKFVGKSG